MDIERMKTAVHKFGEQLAREMALSEKHLQAAKLAVAKFDAIGKGWLSLQPTTLTRRQAKISGPFRSRMQP